MTRKLRVLHITHPDYLPPSSTEGFSEKEINVWKTDFDVVRALAELGHDVRSLGVRDELIPIRDALEDYKPHIVFNLLEQFAGIPEFRNQGFRTPIQNQPMRGKLFFLQSGMSRWHRGCRALCKENVGPEKPSVRNFHLFLV